MNNNISPDIHNQVMKLAKNFEEDHVETKPFNKRMNDDWDQFLLALTKLVTAFNLKDTH